MQESRTAVTVPRQSELESVLSVLRARQQVLCENRAFFISLPYPLLAGFAYYFALLGPQLQTGPRETELAYKTAFLGLAHAVLLLYLAAAWYRLQLASRASGMRQRFRRTFKTSNLLLALSDPDFQPGKGWSKREDGDQSASGFGRTRAGYSLSRRILGFLARPQDYHSVFEDSLPTLPASDWERSELNSNHLLLGMLLVPAALTVAWRSSSGVFVLGVMLLVWGISLPLAQYVVSRSAWQAALLDELVELLTPSPQATSRKSRKRMAYSRLNRQSTK
ncbi:hypothetical protein IT575_03190 [bacterium]|nr:hypothetical protein [bacterium]